MNLSSAFNTPAFEPFFGSPNSESPLLNPFSNSALGSDTTANQNNAFSTVFQSIQDQITQKMEAMGAVQAIAPTPLLPLSGHNVAEISAPHPTLPIEDITPTTPSLPIDMISSLLDHLIEVAEHFVAFLGQSEFDSQRLKKLKEKRDLLQEKLESNSINTYSVSALAISYSYTHLSYTQSDSEVHFTAEHTKLNAAMSSYTTLYERTNNTHMLNDLLFYQLDTISEDNFEDMAAKYLPLISKLLTSDTDVASQNSGDNLLTTDDPTV